MRLIWIVLGLSAVALGLVGVMLPLLPTTPFMLLAAACFAKSSPRLHDWLLNHRVFGRSNRDCRDYRAISPKAKRMAITAMAAAFGLSVVLGLGWKVLAVQAAVLAVMGSWIWTRSYGPQDGS
ncbi:MAG: YbaN family protein [Rhodobacteraceae bacterium]|nr:YbaN family protein [Paracoccaceae bacterium]